MIIEQAITVLEENIASICSVREWAELMGVNSEKHFNRKIRAFFNTTPYRLISEKKLEAIIKHLHKNPDEIIISVALDFGFGSEAALYKFIKRHTCKSPTELRGEVRNGSPKWKSEMEVRNGSPKWKSEMEVRNGSPKS